jgi:hypothetical protein
MKSLLFVLAAVSLALALATEEKSEMEGMKEISKSEIPMMLPDMKKLKEFVAKLNGETEKKR